MRSSDDRAKSTEAIFDVHHFQPYYLPFASDVT